MGLSKLVNSNKKSTISHDGDDGDDGDDNHWFTHSHKQNHISSTFREFILIHCFTFPS